MTPEEHRDQHPEYQENDHKSGEHECSRCVHGYKSKINGIEYCDFESDDYCEFEPKTPTLEQAIKLTECLDVDYGDADQDEIAEIDAALDVIFAFCKKYTKGDESAEWEKWIDGHLGVLTTAGVCSKCGKYNGYQTRYCPYCGRKMKGRFVEE